ncbi:MAG: metal-dependent hydrolase [Ignavibacteriaceae bacterium]
MWKMFAVGHLSLGYIVGKFFGNFLSVKLNWAILFTVSVLTDVDVFFFPFLQHRGIIHSLFFSIILSLPFIVIYRKKAVPYFAALVSHSLVGDIFSGGTQLFWPFSNNWIFISDFSVVDEFNIALELLFFGVSVIIMILSKDIKKFFSNKSRRIYWIIPFGSILGPLVLNTGIYNNIPFLLIIPSLFYFVIFTFRLVLGQTSF